MRETFLQRIDGMIKAERTKGETLRLFWLIQKHDEHLSYLMWCQKNKIEPLE